MEIGPVAGRVAAVLAALAAASCNAVSGEIGAAPGSAAPGSGAVAASRSGGMGRGGKTVAASGKKPAEDADAVTDAVATIALNNVGGMACAPQIFESSCSGNGGEPEYWCADFARWVWEQAGIADTAALTAAAGSFYLYGENHGTLHQQPAVGDAVVFGYAGGGYADHVALVTQVNDDGTIETVSGDWGGQAGSQAQFASTSRVVLNAPPFPSAVGGTPWEIGLTISGYVSPVRGGGGGGGDGGGNAGASCAGLDDGLYCGTDFVGGDAGTLYQCTGGQASVAQVCEKGCQTMPDGTNDACS